MLKPIDVIIPVHGNFADAANAIRSVLSARNETPHNLIVIDDASPEADAPGFFASLGAGSAFTLLRNDSNLGFAATANRGMRVNPDRDVVLLNSDTLVFDFWLDRLRAAIADNSKAATATPLSNAATILSYPHWLMDNDFCLEIGWAQFDALCSRARTPPIRIPTGVGFCFYISRKCLEEVGDFDAARFGKGYGEENDFCLRATKGGWEHLAAMNVFVWHRGGGSFGAERAGRAARAQATLEERHPGYAATIRDFIRTDPMREARAEFDYLRIRASARPRVLVVGETGAAASAQTDKQIVALSRRGPFWNRSWRVFAPGFAPLPNLPDFTRRTSASEIRDRLGRLAVSEVVIPPQGGAGRSLTGRFLQAAAELGVPARRL